MASTAAVDVKELPKSYVFVADVPGLKSNDIRVQVENDNILKISGERKREENSENNEDGIEIKYVRVERPTGKFVRKFNLPPNVDIHSISAACQDGVLTVVIAKMPPPEPYKPKTFQVHVANFAFDNVS